MGLERFIDFLLGRDPVIRQAETVEKARDVPVKNIKEGGSGYMRVYCGGTNEESLQPG